MNKIKLTVLPPANSEHQIDLTLNQAMDQTVEVFLNAFKEEAFTKALLDLNHRPNYDLYFQAVKYKLSLYREVGHKVFVASEGKSIIGTFILRSPHVSTPFGLQLRRLTPHLPTFARLILKYLQAAHLSQAVKPPDNLPINHYALEGLAVHSTCQGQGVGRMMLEKADHVCSEDNTASGIYLYTGDEKNKEIYKHFAYKILEARPTRLFNAYHMFKYNNAKNKY